MISRGVASGGMGQESWPVRPDWVETTAFPSALGYELSARDVRGFGDGALAAEEEDAGEGKQRRQDESNEGETFAHAWGSNSCIGWDGGGVRTKRESVP